MSNNIARPFVGEMDPVKLLRLAATAYQRGDPIAAAVHLGAAAVCARRDNMLNHGARKAWLWGLAKALDVIRPEGAAGGTYRWAISEPDPSCSCKDIMRITDRNVTLDLWRCRDCGRLLSPSNPRMIFMLEGGTFAPGVIERIQAFLSELQPGA